MKHTPFLLLISACSLVLLSTCKKEEPEEGIQPYQGFCPNYIYITGIISDSTTGQPITEGVVESWVEGGLGYLTLDSTGRYHETVGWNPCDPHQMSTKPSGISISLRKDADYYGFGGANLANVPKSSTVTSDIKAVPYSHINVHITGDAGAGVLKLAELIGPPYQRQLFSAGSGLVDTVITIKAYSNRTAEVRMLYGNTVYSSTPVLCGYGSAENIEIHYP